MRILQNREPAVCVKGQSRRLADLSLEEIPSQHLQRVEGELQEKEAGSLWDPPPAGSVPSKYCPQPKCDIIMDLKLIKKSSLKSLCAITARFHKLLFILISATY